MKSTEIPIVKVNHGLANNFGTHIEVNKALFDYPYLLKPILEHEYSHTEKSVSMEDFKLDFILPKALHTKQLFKFMLKHPRSFTQLLPFYWSFEKKKLITDFNLIASRYFAKAQEQCVYDPAVASQLAQREKEIQLELAKTRGTQKSI